MADTDTSGSPNRCQLYTMFNMAEAIKDSGDKIDGATNTSILQYLVEYYGEDFFPKSEAQKSTEGKKLVTPVIET